MRSPGRPVSKPDTMPRLTEVAEIFTEALGEQTARARTWAALADAGERKCLYWKDGVVEGHVHLGDDAKWNEGRLTFQRAPAALGKSVDGRALASVFPHHLLDDSIRIQASHGKPGGHAKLYCRRDLLAFDAASGRMW